MNDNNNNNEEVILAIKIIQVSLVTLNLRHPGWKKLCFSSRKEMFRKSEENVALPFYAESLLSEEGVKDSKDLGRKMQHKHKHTTRGQKLRFT